jgi:F0F1-type ATP synthase assembly protein I
LLAMSNREWLSVTLWVGALGIWIVAGVLGDLPWWLVTIVVIAFGLQVANAVRLALKRRPPQPDG